MGKGANKRCHVLFIIFNLGGGALRVRECDLRRVRGREWDGHVVSLGLDSRGGSIITQLCTLALPAFLYQYTYLACLKPKECLVEIYTESGKVGLFLFFKEMLLCLHKSQESRVRI